MNAFRTGAVSVTVCLAITGLLASGCQSSGGSDGSGSSTTASPSTPSDPVTIDGASPDAPPTPALEDRRVVVSPGHGFYYSPTLGWTTQRGVSNGLIEDIHTNEIAMDFVIPYLEAAGARVFSTRSRSRQTNEVILDQDTAGAAYAEQGTWTRTASSGKGYAGTDYRYAATATSETARATFTANLPEAGEYPVWLWWRAGSNRVTDARVEVTHAGGTSVVEVDQTRDGSRWMHLGSWFFEAGPAEVAITNESSEQGHVIADAVRLGSGPGTIDRGGGVSGEPRWNECARYWLEYVGAPSSVFDATSSSDRSDDVTCRGLYANWQGGDAFLSMHTNAGGGTGTSSFIHDTNPSPGSAGLQDAVHGQLVGDIRAGWDSSWYDRGQKTANFGELRATDVMPATLVEIAFHDQATPDAAFLADDAFRHDVGRALYKGLARYLAPGAPVSPLPPTHLRAERVGPNDVEVSWRAAVDPVEGQAAAPDGYLVHLSDDGRGFDDGTYTTQSSVVVRNLTPGETRFFRVTALNGGGRSLPSPVVACRLAPDGSAPRILVVDGFDRLDGMVTRRDDVQTGDRVIEHAEGIAAAAGGSLGFDGASNEAVEAGVVPIADYDAVDWVAGLESTDDETFSSAEQAVVSAYLSGGGALLVSGAEIAWDLGNKGSTSDRAFLADWLHASYVNDDAGGSTSTARSSSSGPLAGLGSLPFGTGQGRSYEVVYPDAIAPENGASEALSYEGTSFTAGVSHAGTHRTLYLGFPLETLDPSVRTDLFDAAVRFVLDIP